MALGISPASAHRPPSATPRNPPPARNKNCRRSKAEASCGTRVGESGDMDEFVEVEKQPGEAG